ncbi:MULTISPECIES: hypothetical protein [unclassified Exiguobacterium]|uniref:hypothetical protein n=1 Tax=unclassified Exiguobacterium TaxID=2644629 RepID=UPI001BE82011|nr:MULTISPECIES: hypothetical protein [unclassified Exiguobacterium]
MNKTIEAIIATGAFFTFIRLCTFEANFESIIGNIAFDIALILLSVGFGVFYEKERPFEWQELKSDYEVGDEVGNPSFIRNEESLYRKTK